MPTRQSGAVRQFAEERLTSIATEIATEPTGTACDENGPSAF